MMHFREDLSPDGMFALKTNVGLVLRPTDRPPLSNKEVTAFLREGKMPSSCEEGRVSHNIVVDTGRAWLRDHICASSFPAAPFVADQDLPSANGILPNPSSVIKKTYRVRYIALGIGGALQTDPTLGAGAFVEDRSVTGLEDPYPVTGVASNRVWMAQVVPVAALGDTSVLPDATTARFRVTYSAGDIAYPGSTSQAGEVLNTDVPVSEAALLTSQADPSAAPVGDTAAPVAGLLAYNIFRSIPVTPNFDLEIAWDLRF